MRYQTVKTIVRNTSRQQAIGFGLLVVLLLLNAALSYYATTDLIEKESRVQRTLNFLVAIKDTFSALQDAETGQRGFLITGEEKHLEPYEKALANMNGHITILMTLQSDLPEQRNSIESLIELIQAKREEMAHVVSLRKSDLGLAAFNLERSDTGYLLMRQIRELVSRMEQREYNLMSEQRQEAALSRQQVLFAIAVATFTGLLLVGAVFILIQRSIRRQQLDAERLALTNEELEAIVSDRTRAIERYSEELKRSNRELQDFAFVASHDLQEPLRKIRAFGERLKDRFSDQLVAGDGVDYINRMQSAAERMSLLINDLLEFSRVSTRAGEFETISLQAALADVLDNLSEVITGKNATVTAEPLPDIEADPTQMRQLLQNLIGNALKFTDQNVNPLIHIKTETFANERDSDNRRWCQLTIQDNGIGFDERFAERIFTPFQRLHGRGEYAGSGIGLAVCRRVIERHGGSIKVRSKPGLGTAFIIYLPVIQDPELGTLAEIMHEKT
ncbi:MAG: CHASE3 domain-containing protein [Cellvibrionaceae bacterium]